MLPEKSKQKVLVPKLSGFEFICEFLKQLKLKIAVF
jgi:hypothetical protein